MFTGIIEATGTVVSVENKGTNRIFWIASPLAQELKIDQSISHEGVCLTVDALQEGLHRVTAIEETLSKTNLSSWETGRSVNLERCLQFNGRIDGHIVQGHVDTTAECIDRQDLNGSWEFRFRIPEIFYSLIIEKGSVSLNGTSLTIFNITRDAFSVAIIPYTYHHTSISEVVKGSMVNIEFDVIGKYINRRETGV
ncbi:riboflavin synthase [Filimonas effusa]|uniref:Riboflavin synthase n=1 Tax=Filimonas effusa TaxID=2508721 RepID=A0A4Q1DET0_9BACT|nr:riboflavin synthase [Filimonas effusa]RXK87119.1 riboflavin synthase [Filimonas effusa]